MTNNNKIEDYEKSFGYSFRIAKRVFFFVEFGAVKCSTQNPYFATSGGELNTRRTDFERCGQCQSELLKHRNSKAMKVFYEKWDKLHTKALTYEQYEDLMVDLETLKIAYPYVQGTRFYNAVNLDRKFK